MLVLVLLTKQEEQQRQRHLSGPPLWERLQKASQRHPSASDDEANTVGFVFKRILEDILWEIANQQNIMESRPALSISCETKRRWWRQRRWSPHRGFPALRQTARGSSPGWSRSSARRRRLRRKTAQLSTSQVRLNPQATANKCPENCCHNSSTRPMAWRTFLAASVSS